MKGRVGLLVALLALVCLFGGSVGAQKQSASKIVWEYKVLNYTCADDKKLNDLGEQGWELVSVETHTRSGGSYDCPNLYFKRMK